MHQSKRAFVINDRGDVSYWDNNWAVNFVKFICVDVAKWAIEIMSTHVGQNVLTYLYVKRQQSIFDNA